MPRRRIFLAVLGTVALASAAPAATVTVTQVGRPRPGWLRIAVRYDAPARPIFRVVPACPALPNSGQSLPVTVGVSPSRKEAVIELHDDVTWFSEPANPCRVAGLTVEMLRRGRVMARASVPNVPPAATIAAPSPPPPASALPSRLGFAGGKYLAPQTRMSQAGLSWSLTERLTVHLSYERTAFAPIMSKDHDDGIVTGLKLRF